MSFTNKLKNYKCRTCFEATTKGLKPLMNLATDEEEPPITYGEILRQLTNINIMEDKCPEITQLICGGCSRKLKSAYAFVQQAQEVNKELLSMLYRDDSGIKPMDCLQESQVDIESCLEIKIEPDDTLVEEGAGQFEVPPCDVKLKLNKSDEDILTNINAADMLDEVQIKLEDSEGNIITNTDEETTEKLTLNNICKPSIEKSDEEFNDLDKKLSTDATKENSDVTDFEDNNNDDDSDWHEQITNRNSSVQNVVKKKLLKTKSNKPDVVKNSVEDDVAVPCNECNKIYTNSKALAIHQSTCHITEDQKCSCPLCGSKFKQSCNMYKHIRKFHSTNSVPLIRKPSTRDRPYQCDKCSCNYVNKKDLKIHMRTKHSKEDENNEKEKFTESLATDSKKSKIYEQPSLCSICGSSFASRTYLIVHMRRHNGERPFKCDFCDQAYPSKMELTVHRRLHTGEKPYECKICGKVFRLSDKLSKHMRSHTDIRPYKCTQCERSFKYSNDLNIHFRIHTGERPYSCNVCGSTFTQSSSLKTHRVKLGHLEK